MKRFSILFILLITIPFTSNAATLISMTNTQIQQAFVGKTATSIGVDNLNGKTIDTYNAVYLDGHRKIYGKLGKKINALPQYDQGTYTINSDGTIHVTWQHWDSAKILCFHIFETKNAFLSIDCEGVYHSTFMKSAVQPGNQINLQSSH